MKDFFESAFYIGGGILLWSKIGSIILGLAVILFGCFKFNKLLERTQLLRSYSQ